MSVNAGLPVTGFQTFSIVSPPETHSRVAECQEVGCQAYAHGWKSIIDEGTELGQRQAGYIRSHSGRAFTESRTPEGLTEFIFKPEQKCFGEHRVSLERDELFIIRGGDRRGNPRREVKRVGSNEWVDRFATNQNRLRSVREGS